MKEISLAEIEKITKSGGRVIDAETGQALDVKSVMLMSHMMGTLAQIVKEMQIMNQGILEELKRHVPKEPVINVEPKIQVDVPQREGGQWEHEVVEMTRTGHPIKIMSKRSE